MNKLVSFTVFIAILLVAFVVSVESAQARPLRPVPKVVVVKPFGYWRWNPVLRQRIWVNSPRERVVVVRRFRCR